MSLEPLQRAPDFPDPNPLALCEGCGLTRLACDEEPRPCPDCTCPIPSDLLGRWKNEPDGRDVS